MAHASTAQRAPQWSSHHHTHQHSISNGSSALPSSGSPRSIRSVATGSGSVISSLSTAGVPAPTDDELAGRTFLEWLKAWDDAQVARWLNDIRCGSHVSTFASNDIRGNVLLDVDQQALKEMGVQSVGDRIKITVAVKKLRQACTAANVNAALGARRPLPTSSSGSQLSGGSRTTSMTANGTGSAPSSPVYSLASGMSGPGSAGLGGAVVTQAQIVRRTSNGKSAHRIPPPLHLASNAVQDSRLPQAYQPSGAALTPASSATYGARTSSNSAGAALLAAPANIVASGVASPSRLASSPRSGTALPPPKGQLPPPPAGAGQTSSSSSSSRPGTSSSSSRQQQPQSQSQQQQHHLAAPTISTTAASPTASSGSQIPSWQNQPGDFSSLRKPRPAAVTAAAAAGNSQYTHRKSGSTGGSISSISGGAHPYATASSPSQQHGRPSTAAASYQQNHPPHPFATSSSAGSLGLSPIREGGSTSASPVLAEHPSPYHASGAPAPLSTKAQQQSQGYTVGKGGFSRPTTTGGTVSIPAVNSYEDVMRKTVKFIGEDNVSKMVNVEGAKDTQEVLLRVLKKFGKIPSNSFPSSNPNRGRNDHGDYFAEMDGYGVFSSTPDGSTKALVEADLWNICMSTNRPERTRGLILRKMHITPASPDDVRAVKARKLRNFFGEDLSKSAMSPTSPTNMLDVAIPATALEPASPTPTSPGTDSDGERGAPNLPQKTPRQQQRNTMNRASTVSVMSGLNWGFNRDSTVPAGAGASAGVNAPVQARSPSTGFIQTNHQKLRSFFGHRPPSELISTHLVDYFPNAPSEKKILSKAVRNNVRKSMMRRNSSFGGTSIGPGGTGTGGAGKTSWDASRDSQNLQGLGLSRFSVSSAGSSYRGSIDAVPPLPIKDGALPGLTSRFSEDYDASHSPRPSFQAQHSSTSITPSIVLDSDEEEAEAEADVDAQSISSGLTRRTNRKSRPSSRLSIWSQSKSARDSDNASMLTVEEVTEDLERRRLSRASWSADLSGLVAADTSGDSTESDAAASSNLGISDDTLGEDVLEDNIILEEDEEQDEDEEDEEDVEEEEGDEDDEVAEAEEAEKKEAEAADVPQTVTTTTKKSTFRWVKGTLIGSGAFGQVYLGMNARNGSFMAVKQVELPTGKSQNEERKKGMLSALEREIELLKIMHHENIVQYLDSHSDDKHLYIFLEYVPGGSVAHILANLGAFEEALVRTFCKQILAGLAYLHENDIVHRDIKGANILVDNRGTVKISDFGISKKVEENLLTGGSRLNRPSLQGSVFWMAPEVVKQTSYTAKADIWSLGCLIVEMVTGQHPWFELTQMQAIFKIGSAKDARPTIPEDFSPEGQAFLELAFKMDYNERPTAAELSKHDFITQDFIQAE